ncbi:DUF4355 domain-containing protein [uncultured Clostridium sp.]|jgi:hypothetical protein|uniref:DUF4355 domain-containing protein n=1 Tax=uncultured Clostridium sp. TaxID=59620 RepID=UPI0025F1E23F|nr:DUF4355 domain-containing protein [uncultured Clostridium sp.]
MNKAELLALINEVDDNADIDEIILSNGFAKPITDVEGLNKLLESDKSLQGLFDKKVTTGIENFKKNGMQKIIEAEVLKRTGKNETPEQKEIRELKERLDKADKEKAKAEMISKYKDVLTEKKIPSNMIDFLLAQDDETTEANIELFENSMKQYIETGIKAKLGDSEYTPPTGGGNVGKVTWEQVIDNPSLYNTYLEQSKGE